MADRKTKRFPFLEEKIQRVKNIPGQAVETLRSAVNTRRFNRSAGGIPAASQPNPNPFVPEQPTVSFKPTKPEVTTGRNPEFSQLRSEFGGFETPEQRRARLAVATPQTTVQQQRAPSTNTVEISQRNPLANQQSFGPDTPDIDPVKQAVVVGQQGTTISAEQDAINKKQRRLAAGREKYYRVLESVSSTKKQIADATKALKASFVSGDTAAAVGEVAGANVEGLKEGAERGTANRQGTAAERIAKLEAELAVPEEPTLKDANRATVSDDNILKSGTAAADSAAAEAAARTEQRATLEAIAGNKNATKAQRKSAVDDLAKMAGGATGDAPRASRTVGQRATDAFNTARETVGLGAAKTTPTEVVPPGTPPPPTPDGRIKSTVKNVFRGAGALAILDIGNMLIEPIMEKGFGQASADIANGLGTIIKDLPENTRKYLAENSSGDIINDLQSVGVDIAKAMVDAPGAFGNSIAVMLEHLETGNLGGFESGVLFDENDPAGARARAAGLRSAENNGNNFDVVRGASSFFDGGENTVSPENINDFLADGIGQTPPPFPPPQQGQPPIDDAVASDQTAGLRQNFVPPGLNQTREQISDEEFDANNANVNSIQRGLASGTGFLQSRRPTDEGNENFATFIDGRGQPEPQQQGLRAARDEFSNRNRFRDPDISAFANLAGTFARVRQASDRAEFDQTERANAATLAGAVGTAQSKAQSDFLKTRTKEASEIYSQFADSDSRPVAMRRAISQFTSDIEGGGPNPDDPVSIAASDMIAQELMEKANPNIPRAIWNSLMPAFLGGGGRGLLDFLSGEPLLNSQNLPMSLALDEDNDIIIESTDPTVRGIDIGNNLDASLLNFLRRTLPKRVDEDTPTFADATIQR